MSDELTKNTDREIWREVPGDFYSPSIYVTEAGGIGINVGGTVIVRNVRTWHEMAAQPKARTFTDVIQSPQKGDTVEFSETRKEQPDSGFDQDDVFTVDVMIRVLGSADDKVWFKEYGRGVFTITLAKWHERLGATTNGKIVGTSREW